MKKTLALMTVAALMAVGANAALVLEYSDAATGGQTADAVSLGTGISASGGDVIVFATASSKSYIKSYSVVSSDGGAVATQVDNWNEKNASVSYFTVTTGGTFDLSVAGNDQTFDTYGAYIIGSDLVGGSVTELAQARLFASTHTNNTTDVLDYGTVASGGMLVEAANVNVFDTFPAGYTVNVNGGNSRATLDSSFSPGPLSSTYVVGGDLIKNARYAGVAFSEVIPEPATLGIVVFGGTAILFIRRRFMI